MNWITRNILLIGFATICLMGNAHASGLKTIEVRLGCDSGGKIGKPIPLVYRLFFGRQLSNATLDVTLPNGVELIKGSLHWTGSTSATEFIKVPLTVKVVNEGIYDISAVFNTTDNLDEFYSSYFPKRRTHYLYVSEDTAVVDFARVPLERAVRSNWYLPVEKKQALEAKKLLDYQNEHVLIDTPFVHQAQTNIPLCTQKRLNDPAHSNTNYLSDKITEATLSNFYSPKQIELIKRYRLIFSPLRRDFLETYMNVSKVDINNPSPDYQSSLLLANAYKEILTELYALDQRIIAAKQNEDRHPLLLQRAEMLKRFSKKRDKILKEFSERNPPQSPSPIIRRNIQRAN
ncbi:MAG: hypothetical protein OEM52_06755 [bacterium]|nr:hypothetical protein [bacterium]